MSATTSIRGAVKTALLALLRAHADLADVQVGRKFPSDMERRTVYLGRTTGRQEIPVSGGSRVRRDDTFTIDVWFGSKVDGDTDTEAEARCEEMFAALEDILASNAQLRTGTPATPVPGLQWAQLGNVDGPDADGSDDGTDCWIRAEVLCKARLT